MAASTPATPLPEPLATRGLSVEDASNWPRALFFAGILAAVIQNYYFLSHNRFALSQSSPWALGRATDLYILWWNEFPFFAEVWGVAAVAVLIMKLRLPPSRNGRAASLLGWLGVLLMASVLAWPIFFLRQSGHPSAQLRSALSQLRQLEEVAKHQDFSNPEKNMELSSKLGELTEPLKGSSVFYAIWHNFQKKRVIQECGGTGERSWEKKRTCLVLLFTLAVDGDTSIRPSLLGPTASSLVFLSSLDGVIRVLAAEGVNSPHVGLFLDSLQEVGLQQEAADFTALVQSYKGKGFDDLMRALLDLRQSLERKIYESQNSAALPAALKLNLMGPLEMGI